MKIQSISDVITNSSSEVFIVSPSKESELGEIFKDKKDWREYESFLLTYDLVASMINSYRGDMISSIFGLPDPYQNPEEEITEFIEINKEKILLSPFLGNYMIELEHREWDSPYSDALKELLESEDYMYHIIWH